MKIEILTSKSTGLRVLNLNNSNYVILPKTVYIGNGNNIYTQAQSINKRRSSSRVFYNARELKEVLASITSKLFIASGQKSIPTSGLPKDPVNLPIEAFDFKDSLEELQKYIKDTFKVNIDDLGLKRNNQSALNFFYYFTNYIFRTQTTKDLVEATGLVEGSLYAIRKTKRLSLENIIKLRPFDMHEAGYFFDNLILYKSFCKETLAKRLTENEFKLIRGLVSYRLAKGVTVKTVSENVFIGHKSISGYEQGTTKPSHSRVMSIINYLDKVNNNTKEDKVYIQKFKKEVLEALLERKRLDAKL